MIPTIHRRDDAPSTPAPMFDPALDLIAAELIDPLTSPVPPTWRMTEAPEWTALVAKRGDPRSVDAHVDEPATDGDERPVEVAVDVQVEPPPTVALDELLVEWCSTCNADAGDPCRTPSGAVKLGVHPIRVSERAA
jgi:hypothetical protein